MRFDPAFCSVCGQPPEVLHLRAVVERGLVEEPTDPGNFDYGHEIVTGDLEGVEESCATDKTKTLVKCGNGHAWDAAVVGEARSLDLDPDPGHFGPPLR